MADIVLDVPVKTDIWTPNYDHTKGFDSGCPRFVVIHSTRSGVDRYTPDQEFDAVTNYIDHVNERQVGIHWLVGGTKTRRMCHDDKVAWHAKWHSYQGWGIEVCQSMPDHAFTDYQYLTTAQICARYCHERGIPTDRIVMSGTTRGSAEEQKRGIVGHEDTIQGNIDGKSDPGPKWDWGKFIPMVKAEYDRLYKPAFDPYAAIGSGLAAYIKPREAEFGTPRTDVKGLCHWDDLGNEYVWTTKNHLVVYRKANGKIYAYDMPW